MSEKEAYLEAVAELLKASFSPLNVQMRERYIPRICEHIYELAPSASPFLEEHLAGRRASLVLHLQRVVEESEAELEAGNRAYDDFVRRVGAEKDDKARRSLIEGHLRQHATSPAALAADIRALDQRLGLDALRERADGRRHRLEVLIELCLGAMGPLAHASVFEAEHPRHADEAAQLLRTARAATFLVGQAASSARWQNQLAALESLAPLIHALRAVRSQDATQLLAADALGSLFELSVEGECHPWVRVAALSACWPIDPEATKTNFEIVVFGEHQAGDARAFLTRRRALDRLVDERHLEGRPPVETLRTFLLSASQDPSEHVRLGVAEKLVELALAETDDAGWEALAHLMHRDSEQVAKVRAKLIECLSGAREDQLRVHAGSIAGLLARALAGDDSRLVLTLCAVAARDLATALAELDDQEGLSAFANTLLAPLTALSAHDDHPAAVHEVASAAAERIRLARHPELRALRQALGEGLESIALGDAAQLPVPPVVNDEQLGRVLADLTRDDWGVDADREGQSLRVHRGDRYRQRAWRLLHELKHPAPNKRQTHRHSIGRVLSGSLRAPPGRLDEVTATVVPGERLQVDVEGGWGRHLPLVDDLLGLPLKGDDWVSVYSSLGRTRLRMHGTYWQRIRTRLAISRHYARLSTLRTTALASDEAATRGAYLRTLRDEFGVQMEFDLFSVEPDEAPPQAATQLRQLFERGEQKVAAAMLAVIPPELRNWIDLHGHYFFSLEGNSQPALAIFAAFVAGGFFWDGYRRRQRVIQARRRIPLTIGGWGTRGKSGTERLKAGMLHGLGYEVFSKTTGCEAMFIHSIPGGLPVEVYAFRPYGKATIWEQRDLLELAADLEVEVFLWECMALNPHYVEILQRHWMRDDYATITNAYPDHEDIQGPAGINVAEVISNFTPDDGVLITSEINFLPVMRDAAKRRNTQMISIPEAAGDLIGDDFLELFPYQEHPRNIALVARLGEELGIDPQLAILNMADHVVPDLGVLKRYPPSVVRGRQLEFINGCSANERTGFLNNWRRTGCADMDAKTNPGELVITVVNNRDDRISRSEVFSRILVLDSACDKHVLIGTNLRGLLGYIDDALSEFVAAQVIVSEDEVGDLEIPRRRLETLLARVRLPGPEPEAWLQRLEIYGGGCGMLLDPDAREELHAHAQRHLEAAEGPTLLSRVLDQLKKDKALNAALAAGFAARPADWRERKEVLEAPTRVELLHHSLHQLARQVVGARLRLQLESVDSAARVGPYHEVLRPAYTALFKDLLEVVDDAGIKGDGIIDVCARACPPGTQVVVMGAQNIKGTGLDFAYRWLALDAVCRDLEQLESPQAKLRAEALARIEGFSDHGIVDLGEIVAYLEHNPGEEPTEIADRKRVLEHKREYLAQKRAPWLLGDAGALALTDDDDDDDGKKKTDRLATFSLWLEGWVEFLDGARRFHQASRLMKELTRGHISHPRAAVEMRAIYARFKGGWLYEWYKSRKAPSG